MKHLTAILAADADRLRPLDGLHVGLLDESELDALSRLSEAGLAHRSYEGAAGLLGLPKVRLSAAILAALLMGCGGSDEPESRDTANPPQCAQEQCK